MVLTNIMSQPQYIFPHIFLLHFNVSFNTISLLWLQKNLVKNNRSTTERSQHHILNILKSTLLVCFFEGVLLSPVLLLWNTQRFWQIWATLYKYYASFNNSEFPKATERNGIQKSEPAVYIDLCRTEVTHSPVSLLPLVNIWKRLCYWSALVLGDLKNQQL